MTDTKDTRREVVASALSIAEAVTYGHMSTEDLETAAIEQCKELFGTVYGPEDPLWELQVSVVRQVLAFGGMTADELAEWLAVQRSREGAPVGEPEVSWIERALAEGADEDDDTDEDTDANELVRGVMAEVEARMRGDDRVK